MEDSRKINNLLSNLKQFLHELLRQLQIKIQNIEISLQTYLSVLVVENGSEKNQQGRRNDKKKMMA